MRFNSKNYIYTVRLIKIITKLLILIVVMATIYKAFESDTYYEAPNPKTTTNAHHNIAIKDSVFTGTDQKGKHYNIKSKSLLKQDDNLYYVEYVDGLYEVNDSNLQFASLHGRINDTINKFQLTKNVIVTYSDYILKTEELDIDTLNDTASTTNGASVLHLHSSINSDILHLDLKTGVLEFDGNVTTHIKAADFK